MTTAAVRPLIYKAVFVSDTMLSSGTLANGVPFLLGESVEATEKNCVSEFVRYIGIHVWPDVSFVL